MILRSLTVSTHVYPRCPLPRYRLSYLISFVPAQPQYVGARSTGTLYHFAVAHHQALARFVAAAWRFSVQFMGLSRMSMQACVVAPEEELRVISTKSRLAA